MIHRGRLLKTLSKEAPKRQEEAGIPTIMTGSTTPSTEPTTTTPTTTTTKISTTEAGTGSEAVATSTTGIEAATSTSRPISSARAAVRSSVSLHDAILHGVVKKVQEKEAHTASVQQAQKEKLQRIATLQSSASSPSLSSSPSLFSPSSPLSSSPIASPFYSASAPSSGRESQSNSSGDESADLFLMSSSPLTSTLLSPRSASSSSSVSPSPSSSLSPSPFPSSTSPSSSSSSSSSSTTSDSSPGNHFNEEEREARMMEEMEMARRRIQELEIEVAKYRGQHLEYLSLAQLNEMEATMAATLELVRQRQKRILARRKEALRSCVVCLEDVKAVVFQCGHLVTCQRCAQVVSTCPVCRSTITSKIVVHGQLFES